MRKRIGLSLFAVALCLAFNPPGLKAGQSNNEKITLSSASIQQHDIGVATLSDYSATAKHMIAILDSKILAMDKHDLVLARGSCGLTTSSHMGAWASGYGGKTTASVDYQKGMILISSATAAGTHLGAMGQHLDLSLINQVAAMPKEEAAYANFTAGTLTSGLQTKGVIGFSESLGAKYHFLC